MMMPTPSPADPSIRSYSSRTTLPPYQSYAPSLPSSETTPLVRVSAQINRSQEDKQQQENKHHGPRNGVGILILFILVLSAVRILTTTILEPSACDRLREEWISEEVKHNLTVNRIKEKWHSEQVKHNLTMHHIRVGWRSEEVKHNLTMDRIREEWHADEIKHNLTMDRIREEWRTDEIKHNLTMDRIREQWHADEVEHSVKMERLRREWRADEAKHNYTMDQLRLQEEELEREITERRRQEAERERKEKAEREAMKLYWTDLEGERCVSHGVRKYHARLANFHRTIDSNVACKATPIVINGETHPSPDHCKDDWSIIYGYWEVKDDPACNTYWDGLWDKGCTAPGSGYRRFESKLNGVKQGDDGPTMCATTPVTVLHQHFDHPMACPFLGWPSSYYQGVWEVLDSRCS